jgi:hypothetical protein
MIVVFFSFFVSLILCQKQWIYFVLVGKAGSLFFSCVYIMIQNVYSIGTEKTEKNNGRKNIEGGNIFNNDTM